MAVDRSIAEIDECIAYSTQLLASSMSDEARVRCERNRHELEMQKMELRSGRAMLVAHAALGKDLPVGGADAPDECDKDAPYLGAPSSVYAMLSACVG